MSFNRILTNILTPNLSTSTEFYTQLFNLSVQFESDWFVQLVSDRPGLEIGLLIANHQLIPQDFQGKPAGMVITFVVDDANTVFAKAQAMGVQIIQPPQMTDYGQLRLLLKDPAGALIDVSSIA